MLDSAHCACWLCQQLVLYSAHCACWLCQQLVLYSAHCVCFWCMFISCAACFPVHSDPSPSSFKHFIKLGSAIPVSCILGLPWPTSFNGCMVWYLLHNSSCSHTSLRNVSKLADRVREVQHDHLQPCWENQKDWLYYGLVVRHQNISENWCYVTMHTEHCSIHWLQ